jgi:hypothetical protein
MQFRFNSSTGSTSTPLKRSGSTATLYYTVARPHTHCEAQDKFTPIPVTPYRKIIIIEALRHLTGALSARETWSRGPRLSTIIPIHTFGLKYGFVSKIVGGSSLDTRIKGLPYLALQAPPNLA